MDRFICISFPKSIFDEGDIDYYDIVEITDDNSGVIWVRSIEKDKAFIIAKALNESVNNS